MSALQLFVAFLEHLKNVANLIFFEIARVLNTIYKLILKYLPIEFGDLSLGIIVQRWLSPIMNEATFVTFTIKRITRVIRNH